MLCVGGQVLVAGQREAAGWSLWGEVRAQPAGESCTTDSHQDTAEPSNQAGGTSLEMYFRKGIKC